MRPLFILLALTITVNLKAQKEAENWFFGHAALNFSVYPPTVITTTFDAMEGCSSISDANGNLLFYTNGAVVYNKNQVVMANGSNLAGHVTATQSSLIVKKPASTTEYYLFTVGGTTNAAFAYSIVDMSLAAGLGSVTAKNVQVATPVTEKLNATYHCNGTDVWILIHKAFSDEFQCYLLTSSGLSMTPVSSQIGSNLSWVNANGGSEGQMKFSPTGKKLALALFSPMNHFELFDFDNHTGVITHSVNLGTFNNPYGCEFSPDGSKLYGSIIIKSTFPIQGGIVQWHLCTGTDAGIISSATIVDTTFGFFSTGLQIGPFKKIYMSENGNSTLGTINQPNLSGLQCNPVNQSLTLTPGWAQNGLPNFIGSWFREKAEATFSLTSCGVSNFTGTIPMSCSDLGLVADSIRWIFGDPASGNLNSSNSQDPSHNYAANGNYNARLTVYYPCFRDTVNVPVSITDFPTVGVTGKFSICKNEQYTYTGSGASTYSWNGTLGQSTCVLSPTSTSVYTLSGADTNGCAASKIFTVSVNPCLGVDENSEVSVMIFPNPGNGLYNIRAETDVALRVYDTMGRELLRKNAIPGETEVDLRNFSDGVYFVEFNSAKEKKVIRLQKNSE